MLKLYFVVANIVLHKTKKKEELHILSYIELNPDNPTNLPNPKVIRTQPELNLSSVKNP